MKISQLVSRYKEVNPDGHFFDKDTLKFFGNKLANFKIKKTDNANIFQLEYTNWFEGISYPKSRYFNWETGNISFGIKE